MNSRRWTSKIREQGSCLSKRKKFLTHCARVIKQLRPLLPGGCTQKVIEILFRVEMINKIYCKSYASVQSTISNKISRGNCLSHALVVIEYSHSAKMLRILRYSSRWLSWLASISCKCNMIAWFWLSNLPSLRMGSLGNALGLRRPVCARRHSCAAHPRGRQSGVPAPKKSSPRSSSTYASYSNASRVCLK